jgi:integrase
MAWIRKRMTQKSGPRYDVEYRAPDKSSRRVTFRRLRDAKRFKKNIERELAAGGWVDPNLGYTSLEQYAWDWLKGKAQLSPKTIETYESQLRLHILPGLGSYPLNGLTSARIRMWHADLYGKTENPASRLGPSTVAKCYRLLHAILETAVVDDEILRRNPCRIRRAGQEQHAERPIASVTDVFALADAVKPQRRLLVLLAAFGGLRLAELLALRRRHVDVLHRRVVVVESTIELRHGELITKPPKSSAGIRKVHLDPIVFEAVQLHLDVFVKPTPDAYLFTGDKGGQLRRAVWYAEWVKVREKIHLEHLRFHDLRHTHGTLVAQAGATTKETMRRLGHSTVRAAMIYQHGSDERDEVIAGALGDRIRGDLGEGSNVRHLGGEPS